MITKSYCCITASKISIYMIIQIDQLRHVNYKTVHGLLYLHSLYKCYNLDTLWTSIGIPGAYEWLCRS